MPNSVNSFSPPPFLLHFPFLLWGNFSQLFSAKSNNFRDDCRPCQNFLNRAPALFSTASQTGDWREERGDGDGGGSLETGPGWGSMRFARSRWLSNELVHTYSLILTPSGMVINCHLKQMVLNSDGFLRCLCNQCLCKRVLLNRDMMLL